MPSLFRQLSFKTRDLISQFRALPGERQWRIAGGLAGASVLAVCVATWLVFFSSDGAARGNELKGDVVLYTSVDQPLLAPIIGAFEKDTGVKVKMITDTEATKTTGLIERLIAERSSPRADVWWSNEMLGTQSLDDRGILETYASKSEADFPHGWPELLRASDKTWYGFALRARVIAYNTNRVAKSEAPKAIRELTPSRWAGKVGMARPQFGTSRAFIASLVALHGADAARDYLQALSDNQVRLYDGNSAVVRALSTGEIDIGLTDSDDALEGIGQNWPIQFNFEQVDPPKKQIKGLPSEGPLLLPNTVGVVRGCPHPNEARKLADFLLSARVEEMLATSEARNVPIRPALAKKLGMQPIPEGAPVSARDLSKALPEADRIIEQLFPVK
ncbi:MAG: extracellular solute-binding protein [Tepidisphaera sp.]|nr:extracellular solute-binding protein [Tepidisphaera sp.]